MTGRPSPRRSLAAATTVLALVLPAACSKSHTTSPSGASTTVATSGSKSTSTSQEGTPFDPTVLHDISVTVDPDDLEDMIATYESSGEKTWIEATVTIDGATYERAGLRLKGNSSLRGVANQAAESLPYRIRLDKFVDGQNHEGFTDIVVRSNGSATALNEAVALALLAEAGIASQASASTRFTVNDSGPTLRLIVELPDDDAWQDANFDGDGALFKAESSGDWSYRGDDPDSYVDVFDQESGSSRTDLTPVIDLLAFVDEADDATFAAKLGDHLDVESFATYLAMMDLVDNFDDISGPGNNAYLWWSEDSGILTVVPWDLNLAFGVSMGGGGGGQNGGGPGSGAPPGGARGGGVGMPGGDRPDGAPGGGPGGGGGGGFGRANPLVERFHATEAFEKLYDEQLETLRTKLFDSGRAQEILDARAQVLLDQATDLVDADTIQSEADAIAEVLARQ